MKAVNPMRRAEPLYWPGGDVEKNAYYTGWDRGVEYQLQVGAAASFELAKLLAETQALLEELSRVTPQGRIDPNTPLGVDIAVKADLLATMRSRLSNPSVPARVRGRIIAAPKPA